MQGVCTDDQKAQVLKLMNATEIAKCIQVVHYSYDPTAIKESCKTCKSLFLTTKGQLPDCSVDFTNAQKAMDDEAACATP